jgi:cytochrome P450
MSSAATFFLAMAKNAHAQKKAQQEIDSLTDRTRLPTLDDRGNLPYVEAIYRETLRWFPALPLGVPHMATEDDIYSGCEIPKGLLPDLHKWHMF